MADASLAGGEHDFALCQRDRECASGECRLHAVPDPRHVDRQAEVDLANDGVESGRIEARDTPVLQREGAAALERADQRDRTAAAALDVGCQRELARERALARQQLAGIGAGQSDVAPRCQSIGAALERQIAGDAAAGKRAIDLLEGKYRLVEIEDAAHVLRRELRRERDTGQSHLESALQIAQNAGLERFGRPDCCRTRAARCLRRHADDGRNGRGQVDARKLDIPFDGRRLGQTDPDPPGDVGARRYCH